MYKKLVWTSNSKSSVLYVNSTVVLLITSACKLKIQVIKATKRLVAPSHPSFA